MHWLTKSRLSPPKGPDSTRPLVSLALLAGVCAVCRTLPVPRQNLEAGINVPAKESGGMNADFGRAVVHCVAAEPDVTFLRIAVVDRRVEVAYETVGVA